MTTSKAVASQNRDTITIEIAEIVKSIIKGCGKARIVRSNPHEICVSMDLGDSEMDELIGRLKDAAPEGVTVEEEEGGLVSLTWETPPVLTLAEQLAQALAAAAAASERDAEIAEDAGPEGTRIARKLRDAEEERLTGLYGRGV